MTERSRYRFRTAGRTAVLALTLAVGFPALAWAQQGRGQEKGNPPGQRGGAQGADAWWEPAAAALQQLGWIGRTAEGERTPVFRARFGETGRTRPGRGRAPSFCRTGEGHPVHGRDWCLEMGFGLGDRDALRGLGDIILRDDDRRERLDERDLLDVLGQVVLGRVAEAAGISDRDLSGRFVREGVSGRVLQLRTAGSPVAELVDTDADGIVDGVILSPGGS